MHNTLKSTRNQRNKNSHDDSGEDVADSYIENSLEEEDEEDYSNMSDFIDDEAEDEVSVDDDFFKRHLFSDNSVYFGTDHSKKDCISSRDGERLKDDSFNYNKLSNDSRKNDGQSIIQDQKQLRKLFRQKRIGRCECSNPVTFDTDHLDLISDCNYTLDDLTLMKSIVLTGVIVKCRFTIKEKNGNLQLTMNGLKYTKGDEEILDVPYRNIKNIVFGVQGIRNSATFHISLIDPIKSGRSTSNYIQFSVTQSGSRKLNVKKDKCVFRTLANALEKMFPRLHIDEFDSRLLLNCIMDGESTILTSAGQSLVSLDLNTPMVIDTRNVEFVHFERVGFNIKTFDIAIVFKDYAQQILRISYISNSQLMIIKEWLNSLSILYSESPTSSNLESMLKEVLDQIYEDPNKFVETGWEVLWNNYNDEDINSEDERCEKKITSIVNQVNHSPETSSNSNDTFVAFKQEESYSETKPSECHLDLEKRDIHNALIDDHDSYNSQEEEASCNKTHERSRKKTTSKSTKCLDKKVVRLRKRKASSDDEDLLPQVLNKYLEEPIPITTNLMINKIRREQAKDETFILSQQLKQTKKRPRRKRLSKMSKTTNWRYGDCGTDDVDINYAGDMQISNDEDSKIIGEQQWEDVC